MTNLYHLDQYRKLNASGKETAETQTRPPIYKDVDEQMFQLLLGGNVASLATFYHPDDYARRQEAGDNDETSEDLLGTDRYPILFIPTHLTPLESIEPWGKRFGEELRICLWQEVNATFYDPQIASDVCEKYPYSHLARAIEEAAEKEVDLYQETMDAAWIEKCKDDEDAYEVLWSIRGHTLFYRAQTTDDEGVEHPTAIRLQFGWPDKEALAFALKMYTGHIPRPLGLHTLEYTLEEHFAQYQDRK